MMNVKIRLVNVVMPMPAERVSDEWISEGTGQGGPGPTESSYIEIQMKATMRRRSTFSMVLCTNCERRITAKSYDDF